MPSTAALIARDQRILAGHRAGTTILQLCLSEDVSPEIVRRVLRRAGIAPGAIRRAKPNANPDCLADRAWLAAEYATKGAQQIAKELGCPREAVYEALRAAGIPMRANGHGPVGPPSALRPSWGCRSSGSTPSSRRAG